MKRLIYPKEKHWLFGNGWYLRKDPLINLPKFARKYGDIYGLITLRFPLAVINHPRLVKEVLLERRNEFQKSFGYEVLAYLLGEGLLTSDGEKWKQQRKLMQPAFHRERLKNLVDIMAEEACKLESDWKEGTRSGSSDINLTAQMNSITLEIIARTMFSTDVEPIVEEVSDQVSYLNEDAIHRITHPFRPPSWVPTPRNQKSKSKLNRMDEILYELIDRRRDQDSKSDDLLDMLLDARTEDGKEGMSREQVRHEAMTIFIAGHETTAVAMGYTFFLLSGEAEIKNKLREEVRAFRPTGPIQFEDLNKLTYTKQVIEESMRLYPPAWIIGRRNIEPMEIEDFVIKKQTNILIPVFQLHRDERFWDDPNKFDPDRFRPEVRNSIDRFLYIPFGAGPRTCIGNHFAMMEMQILLATLIRDMDFEVPPSYNLDPQPLITLRPKTPIPLKLQSL